jgi:DNA polymerase-1
MRRYIVQSEQGLNQMCERLDKHREAGFDTEFWGGRWVKNPELVSFNFAVHEPDGYHGWYVPMGHTNLNNEFGQPKYHNMPREQVLAKCKPWLQSKKKTKVMHSAETDGGLLSLNGIEVGDTIEDTMLMSYHYDENKIWETGLYPYRLKEVSKKVLGRKLQTIPELMGRKESGQANEENKYDIRPVPIDKAAVYGTDDAIHTLMLKEWFEPELRAEGLYDYYRRIDVPLVRVLREMIKNGIAIDTCKTSYEAARIEKRLLQLKGQVIKAVGHDFNLNSRQQLGKVLFEELRYRLKDDEGNELDPEMTSGGKKGVPQYKTSDDVMVKLAEAGFQVPVLMRTHGDLGHFKSAYLDRFLSDLDAHNRYHPDVWQVGTVTGRFTSDFQQLPRDPLEIFKGQPKCDIRSLIIAMGENRWLIRADQNQLELRVLAHFSQDPILLDAYRRALDLHQVTADLAGISRQDAKPINFGLAYGLSLQSLQEIFGKVRGAELFKVLRQRFKVLLKYTAAFHMFLHETEELRTLLGHKRRLPDINSESWSIRSHAERQGFNTLIQGSGADIMKVAQIECFRKVPEALQLMQVHDELLFEFHGTKRQAKECARELGHIMSNVVEISVPLLADPGVGRTWRDAKEAA